MSKAELGRLATLLDLFDQKSTSRLQTALVVFGALVTFAFYFAPDHPAVDTGLGRLGALIEVARHIPSWSQATLAGIAAVHLAALGVVTTAHGAINEIHVFPVANPEASAVFGAFQAGRLTATELRVRYIDFQAGQVERRDRWFGRQRWAYLTGIMSAILFVVVAIWAAAAGQGHG